MKLSVTNGQTFSENIDAIKWLWFEPSNRFNGQCPMSTVHAKAIHFHFIYQWSVFVLYAAVAAKLKEFSVRHFLMHENKRAIKFPIFLNDSIYPNTYTALKRWTISHPFKLSSQCKTFQSERVGYTFDIALLDAAEVSNPCIMKWLAVKKL